MLEDVRCVEKELERGAPEPNGVVFALVAPKAPVLSPTVLPTPEFIVAEERKRFPDIFSVAFPNVPVVALPAVRLSSAEVISRPRALPLELVVAFLSVNEGVGLVGLSVAP